VVLVVWNQLDLTRACLESFRACTTPFGPRVVDNGRHGGGTRSGRGAAFRPDEDLQQRRAALRRFATKSHQRLPRDVRSRWRRVSERCFPRTGARRRS
jgi:hypothetical protein